MRSGATGGIDLDDANWKLTVEGSKINSLKFNTAQLKFVDFDGLAPQLTSFIPVISVIDFIGGN